MLATDYFNKVQLENLPKLYETEEIALEDKIVLAKFHCLKSDWEWFAIEFDGYDICWGLVRGDVEEYGYFSLLEFERLWEDKGIKMAQDASFEPCMVRDLPPRDYRPIWLR